jgi:excisionase family DNA binding protein
LIFPFAYLVFTLYDDVQRYATGKIQMKKMLTSSQIALQIGVTKNTIIKMAKAGQIPSIRIGSGHYRFDIDDVKLALNSGGSDQ